MRRKSLVARTGRPKGPRAWHIPWSQRTPCPHDPDHRRKSRCTICRAEYQRQYHARRYDTDPEYRASFEHSRLARKLRPETRLDDNRAKRFRIHGITLDQYHAKYESQNECCAICGAWMGSPDIDHDHVTKRVRALLCGPCNRGLGHFNDDPARCRAAATYLERWA